MASLIWKGFCGISLKRRAVLQGARYAALGVISHDGSLERFIHVGVDDETVKRIGPLPQGKGFWCAYKGHDR